MISIRSWTGTWSLSTVPLLIADQRQKVARTCRYKIQVRASHQLAATRAKTAPASPGPGSTNWKLFDKLNTLGQLLRISRGRGT